MQQGGDGNGELVGDLLQGDGAVVIEDAQAGEVGGGERAACVEGGGEGSRKIINFSLFVNR